MRQIYWKAIIAGTLVALALVWSSTIAIETVIRPIIIGLAPSAQWIVVIATLILSHLLGGFVTGRIAASSPGLNGAITAVLSALVGIARFLPLVLPFAHGLFFGPEIRSPIQEQAFSENVGLITWNIMMFGLYFPFTVLAAYIGGLLGGHVRLVARRGAGRAPWQGLR